METMAELIRVELQKEDILKDIKEPLVKAMLAQFKERGYAKIRWGYKCLSNGRDKDEFGEYICILDEGRRKLELRRWLSEQGFYFKKVYNREGAEWGLEVTLPGY